MSWESVPYRECIYQSPDKEDHMRLHNATLEPAYGRRPRTAAAAIEDFEVGRDFVLDFHHGGKPCSIRDFAIGDRAELRFYGKKQNDAWFPATTGSVCVTVTELVGEGGKVERE